MTATHEIAREYAEPIEGLYPINEMLTVECTCGEEMSTFCVDRAATSKALAAEHASHAASMRETDNAWTITKSAHPDCTDCTGLKESAVIHARVTGSIGATYTTNDHSCTVARKPKHPHNALNADQSTPTPSEPAKSEQSPTEDFSKPETLNWTNDFTRALASVIEGHEDDDTAEVIEWLHTHESDSHLWDMINTFTSRIQSMARAERN